MHWRQTSVRLMVLFAILLLASTSCLAQVTLTLQYRSGDTRAETVAKWIEEFESLHPDIRVEWYPAPSGYVDKTIVAWASGTGPDVTEIWGSWAQDYARAGVLMDLRPYVERDFTDEDIKDFYPVAWDAATLKHGENAGLLFGIPRYMITTVYYYNQDMFERAGLPNPSELEAAGEWTYETMRQIAKKLTITNGDQVRQWGFTTDSDAYRRLAVWVRAFGGEWVDPDNPSVFRGDEREAVEAITFLQDMIWVDGSTTGPFDSNSFRSGSIAMCEDGNHAVLSRYAPQIGNSFEWDIAPVPQGRNGRKAYTGDDRFVIWRDTPHPDAAWKLVKFLTSRRGQEIAAQCEGLAPVRQSALSFYQSLADQYNLVEVLMTNMMDAGSPQSSYMVGDVGAFERLMRDLLDSVLERGEKPYAQAIGEARSAIDEILRVGK